MQYRKLGQTDIVVSLICLGTMTFGEQNSEAEGHQQLDYAVEHGVNFIDTAELYAIPPRAETYGRTEEIIGSWLAKRGKRDDLVIASKIAGPGEGWVDHIRGGRSRFDRHHIETALNASLKRLQSDYLDLYQLHWPERATNYFGRLGYQHSEPNDFTPIEETLSVLKDQVDAGKVRTIGLSNETPWGVMKFLQVAERLGLPRVVSVQNPYSLLNRSFEVGLAEIAHREGTGLLAYSPLGFGVLSGKYIERANIANSRLTLWPDYDRYSNEQATSATRAYTMLARMHRVDPAQMALAYVNSRSFTTANIIGATTMAQLKNNIESVELELSEDLLHGIESIHTRHPNPSP
ncbi:MAG: NADP(H)-dependent aldo-keto reductase [Chromatiales bacterium]|nr:NADP(H)-dependent aldo-keto reductase [Chromatiales bacterium]